MKKQPPMTWTVEKTVNYLLARGYSVALCECRVSRTYKFDVWGFDVEAKKPDVPGTLRIQATDNTHHARRVKERLADKESLGIILATGDQAEVWSWHHDDDEPRREVLRYQVDKKKLTLREAQIKYGTVKGVTDDQATTEDGRVRTRQDGDGHQTNIQELRTQRRAVLRAGVSVGRGQADQQEG
jgi:hypothetical protein